MNLQAIANAFKRATLPIFGSLPVADVDRSGIMIARCKRGANTGIHPPAEEYDCALRFVARVHSYASRNIPVPLDSIIL
jgi:hypothetical protein